jgi:CRP-like cAMP-binding protein
LLQSLEAAKSLPKKARFLSGFSCPINGSEKALEKRCFQSLLHGCSRCPEIGRFLDGIFLVSLLIMSFDTLLQAHYPLPPASLDSLRQAASLVDLPKGTILFTDNLIGEEVYFLQQGMARAYVLRDQQEVTFWFGGEGTILLSIQGYLLQRVSYETIELLEDSHLVRLSARTLRRLYTTDIHLANWGRVLVEQEWLRTEQQLIARQFRTAAERYAELLQQRPDLLQRVSLGHIASYLGITQVTLSRVRASLR